MIPPCESGRKLPVLALAGSLVSSSVLFAPVWVVRMIFGKLRNAGPLSVRVMPLLGAAFLIVFDVALAIGLRGTKMCQGRFKIGGS